MASLLRSHDDFILLLKEQIDFLSISSELYDNGKESEAKRIALAIRILLHDTKNSTSLLEHLKIKLSTYYYDTAFDISPNNLMTHVGLAFIRTNSDNSNFIPLLNDFPYSPKWVPFDTWWNNIIIIDNQKRSISRKDLILTMSNQEGGAHIDEQIKEFYFDLTQKNSLSWVFNNSISSNPILGAEFASVRQIGYEILKTLKEKQIF